MLLKGCSRPSSIVPAGNLLEMQTPRLRSKSTDSKSAPEHDPWMSWVHIKVCKALFEILLVECYFQNPVPESVWYYYSDNYS